MAQPQSPQTAYVLSPQAARQRTSRTTQPDSPHAAYVISSQGGRIRASRSTLNSSAPPAYVLSPQAGQVFYPGTVPVVSPTHGHVQFAAQDYPRIYYPLIINPAAQTIYEKYENDWIIVAHTLVLMNVWGIPLSMGSYLELYWNSIHHENSLEQIIGIAAVQLFGILGFTLLHGYIWTKCRAGHKILHRVGTVGVILCQWTLLRCTHWWQVFLVQGVLTGIFLGMLHVASTLAFSTYYRNRIRYVSTSCGSMGPFGALLATLINRWMFMYETNLKYSIWVTASASTVSLLLSSFLLQRSKERQPFPVQKLEYATHMFLEKATTAFLAGYFLIWFGLFAWPVFLITATTQLMWPEYVANIQLAMLGAAWAASWIVARPGYGFPKYGTLNLFIIASLVATASLMFMGLNFNFLFVWIASPIYGAAFGTMLTLYVRVIAVFNEGAAMRQNEPRDDPVRIAMALSLMGIAAAGGVMALAGLTELINIDRALLVIAGLMLVGTLLLILARALRIGKWKIAFMI